MKKRKVLFSVLLSLCLLVSFSITASADATKMNCSWSNVICKGVNITPGSTSTYNGVAYSDYVYAQKGQSVAVNNGSDGAFNLVTQLMDSNGNVLTPEIGFHQTVYAKVPKNGNYRVRVTCKDSSTQKRCSGFGSLSNP